MSNEQAEKSASEMMREAVSAMTEAATPEDTTPDVVAPQDNEAVPEESGGEDSIEAEARALGWRPVEDFKGDKRKFVGPEEFLRRQELFDKIDSQKKHIKKLEKQVSDVAKYVKTLTESEYTKQLASLKAQRQIAIEDGDVAVADKLNDTLIDMQVAKKAQEAEEKEATVEEDEGDSEQAKQELQAQISSWMDGNSWYKENPELQEMADDFGELFAKKHPDKTLTDLLAFVDSKMKRHIASLDNEVEEEAPVQKLSKVTTPAKRSAAGVKGAKSRYSRSDLNSTQLAVLQQWILPQKVMSESEYIDSLVKSGELSK